MKTPKTYQHKISAGIIGATGYAGIELAALLNSHPSFDLALVASTSKAGETLGAYYKNLPEELAWMSLVSVEDLLTQQLDVVFLAVPHTTALDTVAALIEQGVRVVDLSADYRLKNAALYEQYYHVTHTYTELLKQAVYGLCELKRADIVQAQLVANPGCYPTATGLACAPALAEGIVDNKIPLVVSAVSGYSGAGKKACAEHGYQPSDENINAYKPLVHQHTPEIEQTLSGAAHAPVQVAFTPHIASYKRGIFASCFLAVKAGISKNDVRRCMESAYAHEPFVTVLPAGEMPDVAQVRGTNNALLGWHFDERTHILYVACALDNLVKGAAGQALQNANIMFGFDECEGLQSKVEVI